MALERQHKSLEGFSMRPYLEMSAGQSLGTNVDSAVG
jgi:hypothetical protein